MKFHLDVAVVSSSPIYAQALSQLLDAGSNGCSCCGTLLDISTGRHHAAPHDVALLAPLVWQEMRDWLPDLRKRVGGSPWLVLADLRMSGMFLSCLEEYSCTLVDWGASPPELQAALSEVADNRAPFPPRVLPSLFARSAPTLPDGGLPLLPSRRQLEIGCAISLGLYNRQIAELLSLGDGTVKTHVHHLIERLGVSDRWELGAYFQEAFAVLLPPRRQKKTLSLREK